MHQVHISNSCKQPERRMRLTIKILLGLIFFSFLTLITQVGGVVFLISTLTFGLIEKRLNRWWTRVTAKVLSFTTLYVSLCVCNCSADSQAIWEGAITIR